MNHPDLVTKSRIESGKIILNIVLNFKANCLFFGLNSYVVVLTN